MLFREDLMAVAKVTKDSGESRPLTSFVNETGACSQGIQIFPVRTRMLPNKTGSNYGG